MPVMWRRGGGARRTHQPARARSPSAIPGWTAEPRVGANDNRAPPAAPRVPALRRSADGGAAESGAGLCVLSDGDRAGPAAMGRAWTSRRSDPTGDRRPPDPRSEPTGAMAGPPASTRTATRTASQRAKKSIDTLHFDPPSTLVDKLVGRAPRKGGSRWAPRGLRDARREGLRRRASAPRPRRSISSCRAPPRR